MFSSRQAFHNNLLACVPDNTTFVRKVHLGLGKCIGFFYRRVMLFIFFTDLVLELYGQAVVHLKQQNTPDHCNVRTHYSMM
jgi:hypothetical protein